VAPFFDHDTDLTPERVKQLHEAGEIQLVDVREQYEWDAGRIAGARHVEMERLASQADAIDRDRPVVFVCRAGARSGMAAQAFRGSGHDGVGRRRPPDGARGLGLRGGALRRRGATGFAHRVSTESASG
jgi:hydroxyacylglutathione hydrolase/adenylyltransferase/sulfurtransferase